MGPARIESGTVYRVYWYRHFQSVDILKRQISSDFSLYTFEVLISSKEILITRLEWRVAESHDQPIITAMVVVPVAAVNCSRPYSRGALILQAISPLRELWGLAMRDYSYY